MHLVFLEKVNEDGNLEISIVEGADELEKAIAGEFTTPKKMLLTAEQKEENIDGLKDILSGAFCFQGMDGATYTVKNEAGEELNEYKKSLYGEHGGPMPGMADASGGGCDPSAMGGMGGHGAPGGGCCGGGHHGDDEGHA